MAVEEPNLEVLKKCTMEYIEGLDVAVRIPEECVDVFRRLFEVQPFADGDYQAILKRVVAKEHSLMELAREYTRWVYRNFRPEPLPRLKTEPKKQHYGHNKSIIEIKYTLKWEPDPNTLWKNRRSGRKGERRTNKSISLPQRLIDSLEQLAEILGTTFSHLIEDILQSWYEQVGKDLVSIAKAIQAKEMTVEEAIETIHKIVLEKRQADESIGTT